MRKLFVGLTVCLLAISVSAGSGRNNDLSYADIVARMYDMRYLSSQPIPGEQSGAFSSWDRGARYDEAAGKYVDWWANRDGDGFMDNKGTMMKLDGPGVIWRIWSAMPKDGNVEIFIDGATEPTLVQPFIGMFTKPPYSNYPELVHIKARGQNFFVPIPFQKSIRIVGAKDWGKYYQITYTKFPEGTKVPSFTGSFSDADKAALKKANDVWGKRGARLFVSKSADVKEVTVELLPGEERVIAEYKKAAAITSFTVARPAMTRAESLDVLRELTVSMTWDKDKKPAVWAPLGDFFGTSGGENLYRSLATGMTEKEYYSNWYMPFERAKIVVRNDGKRARTLSFTIHTEKVKGGVDGLLRFHCKWHRDDFNGFDRKQLEKERWPDWPVLKVDGAAGRFCGFHAHMWNPNHLWNAECKFKYAKPFPKDDAFKPDGSKYGFYKGSVARNYWWGEGDEKFFVDGEKMPSTFGTGTEDYFGYAWGTPTAYDSALQAQPLNGDADEIGKAAGRAGPGNIGHICMVRWQIADNVPFQKSFEAVIEKYHPNEWPLLNAYGVSWYQSAGTTDYYGVVPAEDRTGYYIPATPKKRKPVINGKYEAEEDTHVEIGRGDPAVQEMSDFGDGWSGNAHLLWRPKGPRALLTLNLNVEKNAKGLALGLTKANDYGKFEFMLDGKKIGEPIDLYDANVVRAEDIVFKDVNLKKGPHKVEFRALRKNEKSKGFLFGLDYIKLGE